MKPNFVCPKCGNSTFESTYASEHHTIIDTSTGAKRTDYIDNYAITDYYCPECGYNLTPDDITKMLGCVRAR
jgi:predicted nucleic-acid-binding Zn-ribbon protein